VAKRGDNDALDALVGGTGAGETMLDTEHHREAFREALQEALAMLTAREKTLLRLHFLDGMNIDALGTVFQVHRATVARWLVSIRTRVLEDVRQPPLPGDRAPARPRPRAWCACSARRSR
jgi:RNA polymerase sigma-70 factor